MQDLRVKAIESSESSVAILLLLEESEREGNDFEDEEVDVE